MQKKSLELFFVTVMNTNGVDPDDLKLRQPFFFVGHVYKARHFR